MSKINFRITPDEVRLIMAAQIHLDNAADILCRLYQANVIKYGDCCNAANDVIEGMRKIGPYLQAIQEQEWKERVHEQ